MYSRAIRGSLSQLESEGYRVLKVKNTWSPGAPYKGVNVNLEAVDGQKFELQFHTPESFEMKQENHLLYEAARITENPKAHASAVEKMVARSAALEPPPGIETIQNFPAKRSPAKP